ncbi:Golgi apparatus protein 1 [Orchesella cincta]|uniref:Golgi apparatus protein 1 n=1 Tax=Orchesella cincta TaxID=48709 RepID=A0A1D2NGA5_ORCCI|nr:Golgi apparatus protein 1 [Orchesella cincta]
MKRPTRHFSFYSSVPVSLLMVGLCSMSVCNASLPKIESDLNSLDSTSSHISTNPVCQAEVTRLCGRKPENLDDLDVLECVLNQKRNVVEEISDQCNDILWHYRKSITEESGFLALAKRECGEELDKVPGCTRSDALKLGMTMVTCIIDKKDKISNLRCQSLITRLEGVVFSDYELIERFADKCQTDIERLQCGRNDVSLHLERLPHTQGKTIECLSNKIKELSGACAVEILRIAELQVDDFHLDRALFFACRDDREKFCSRVQAGNGRVYKCLIKHKLAEEMSGDCREQLYRRQRLGWQDYRASGIVSTCKNEIKKFKCRRDASSSDRNIRLSQILLCLENEAHKGHELNGDCVEEIKEHRRALMEDFRVTPELLSACKEDKDKYCSTEGLSGRTIHCLMAHAQSRHLDERISDQCVAQLERLVKLSDVSGDWRVDPVLHQNCQPVVEKSNCDRVPTNRVLDCLMNLLSSDASIGTENSVMTEQCEMTLLQIQYFLARDFPMDSMLYEACHKDATNICGAKEDWADDPRNMDPSRGPMVLSCLFRNIDSEHGSKISATCADRVRQTMRQRALSVRLIPEIEQSCMNDLSDICSDKTKPGEELECLQDHLEELEKDCKMAVGNYTAAEMKNPTVDPFIWRHCRDIIESKCADEKSDDTDMLECLIDYKSEMKSKKCRASVDHLQLLRLKDINFSPKFKTQCHESVVRFCNDMRPITAGKLVSCLSQIIRDDTVNDNTQRINKGCRKQVRYLILSKIQLEDDKADPNSIYALCRTQIRDLCPDVTPGGGRILECLRTNEAKIKPDSACHNRLFHVQQEVNSDSKVDVTLASECEDEIRYFCSGPRVENLVFCLRMSMSKEGFNMARCGKVVRERLMEQNSDSRLSPRLNKACKMDIKKFCGGVHPGEGRIIGCLKDVFVNPKSKLSTSCKEHIEGIIESAAQVDIRMDGILYAACRSEIQNSCKDSGIDIEEGDKGKTEECLKQLFRQNKIPSTKCMTEVAQLIKSTMVDIHVDPLLNQACAMDLLRYCDNIPPGEGRLVACLFDKLDEEKTSLKGHLLYPKCRELLSQRSELFRLAGASPARLESIQDIVISVKESPSRNYFLIVAMSVVGCIFIFGLVCGRATKRRAMSKNK